MSSLVTTNSAQQREPVYAERAPRAVKTVAPTPGCALPSPEHPAQACPGQQLQETLFAALSHELLTPITTIQGYLSLLANGLLGGLSPEQAQAAHLALGSVGRLHSLLGDLLDFAALSRDALTLAREPVAVAEVLAHGATYAATLAQEKAIRVDTRCPRQPGMVDGDRARLIRALEHLLENAVKFSPRGSTIHLAATRRGACVFLAVRDQGAGMTRAERDQALHPFTQGEQGLSRQYCGLGLGLPLVQRLAMLHGGELRLRSAPGRGTIATLVLPVHEHR